MRASERGWHASLSYLFCLCYCQQRDYGAGSSDELLHYCAAGSRSAGAALRSSRASNAPTDRSGDWKKRSGKPSSGDSAEPCTISATEGNRDELVGGGRETRGCQYCSPVSACANARSCEGRFLSQNCFFFFNQNIKYNIYFFSKYTISVIMKTFSYIEDVFLFVCFFASIQRTSSTGNQNNDWFQFWSWENCKKGEPH